MLTPEQLVCQHKETTRESDSDLKSSLVLCSSQGVDGAACSPVAWLLSTHLIKANQHINQINYS